MKKRSKVMKRLEARRKDYDNMVSTSRFQGKPGQYHRPGSNKK